MAQIVVNDEHLVNGHLSLTREKVPVEGEENKFTLVHKGVFSTHLYIEDIHTLEIERFKMNNVDVYREDFGSDDYNVNYYFTCDSLDMHGDEYEGMYFIIGTDEMKKIEDIMYKDEHKVLGDIGAEFISLEGGEEEDE